MNISLKEVGIFGFVSMIMGIALTILGCFWDGIVSLPMFHQNIVFHKGYGVWQILWMGFWALYSFWAWTIGIKWSEYCKLIHGNE